MASKAATLGDPRRPQEVKKISSVNIPAVDDLYSQTLLIAALSCGVSGLLFQYKFLIWSGLFFVLAAYAHAPYDSANSSQLAVMVLTLLGWATMQVYFKAFVTPRQTAAPSPPPVATIEE